MKKVAIIGAGISGLNLARNFKEHNIEYIVFEKARGIGGRMSTRRADEFSFDHGAQCFTARTEEFKAFIKPYQEKRVVEEWKGKVISIEEGKKIEKRIWFEPHLVASPAMNSLCKELGKDLNIRLETEVIPIKKQNDKWQLTSKNNEDLGEFDWVISTAPPVQTYNLIPEEFSHREAISKTEMHANFAVMLGFNSPLNISWIAAKIRQSKIKWVSINSSKPSRNNEKTCIVIHSKDSWADKNKDLPVNEVQEILLSEFTKLTGIDFNKADLQTTHRWLYSIVASTEKVKAYIDEQNNLAACGDWCLTSRVEEAWLSSEYAFKKIIASL